MTYLLPIIRSLLFWWLLFLIQAVVFMAVHAADAGISLSQAIYALWKGLLMNLSVSSLLTLPVWIGVAITAVTGRGFETVNRVIRIIGLVLIAANCLISATDISVFHAWGSKINLQALDYLKYPREVAGTVFDLSNLGFALIALAEFVCFGYVWLRVYPHIQPRVWPALKTGTALTLTAGLMFVAVRGSVRSEVLNRNHVFHSPVSLLNYTAMNSTWNLLDLLMKPKTVRPEYRFMSAEDAALLVKKAHAPAGGNAMPWTVSQPNVIIVFLESWGADAVAAVGGEAGITPGFSKLASGGLLFDHFYANGTRTEQGMLAVLSGSPALAQGSLLHDFGAFEKLPGLFADFNRHGYHSSYFYGGRLSFDNVEAYLRSAGVHEVTGIGEINPVRRTKWGAYDAEVFDRQLQRLKQEKGKFFSVISTLTSHEWFDGEVTRIFRSDQDHVNDDYRNTVHYTDSCLSDFVQRASREPWYAETLIVMVADHACNFPKHRDIHDPERFHIPMLITGGALKPAYRGKVMHVAGAQTDIPATLLSALGWNHDAYVWSKDLMNPAGTHFAWYAFDHGCGYADSLGHVIYDHNSKKTWCSYKHADSMHAMKLNKAMLQYQGHAGAANYR